MDTERVDLSPLDLAEDQVGYRRLVHRILEAADPELARRAQEAGPLALVAGWARPTLVAAAIIAAIALGGLMAGGQHPAEPASSMVDALGVPAPAADWLESGREPSTADLVLAMEKR